VNIFSPIIGVPLFTTLDTFVDSFQLGFWSCGPNQYVMHNFSEHSLNRFGLNLDPTNPGETLLHGYQVILTSLNPSLQLPPVGVFNWHYVQCVLKKFSTSDYQNIQNIYYFCLPFRTRDDIEDDESDRDFDDERNIANPPYPSYMMDLIRYRARQRLEEEERNRTILTWRVSGNSWTEVGIIIMLCFEKKVLHRVVKSSKQYFVVQKKTK